MNCKFIRCYSSDSQASGKRLPIVIQLVLFFGKTENVWKSKFIDSSGTALSLLYGRKEATQNFVTPKKNEKEVSYRITDSIKYKKGHTFHLILPFLSVTRLLVTTYQHKKERNKTKKKMMKKIFDSNPKTVASPDAL